MEDSNLGRKVTLKAPLLSMLSSRCTPKFLFFLFRHFSEWGTMGQSKNRYGSYRFPDKELEVMTDFLHPT